jgi:hypothetical protein
MGVEFTSDNQPEDRKPRGKGKKTLMLNAIREVCADEEAFLKQVVTIGLGGVTKVSGPGEDEEFEYKQPNPMLLNMVLGRIEPPLKSVTPTFEFEFDPDADLHKQAKQVLDAMAKGKIPSDVGQLFITSISSMLNIQEKTDFEERLKAIEDASKQG